MTVPVNPTPGFQEFESVEAMFDEIERRRTAAYDSATEAQRAIGYGDHWLALYEMGPGQILAVFGYCWTRAESVEASIRAGSSDAEAKSEDRMLAGSHEGGYRFGRAYSVVEPEGELGSTHIASMVGKLTSDQFEQARGYGWDLAEILEDPDARAWFEALVR